MAEGLEVEKITCGRSGWMHSAVELFHGAAGEDTGDSRNGWVAAALRLGIHQRGVAGLHFAEYDAKWKEVGTEPISAGELWGSRVCQQ